jgi:hypothetical protein
VAVVRVAIGLAHRYQLQPGQPTPLQLDRVERVRHHQAQVQTALIQHSAQSHQRVAVVVAAAQGQVKLARMVVRAAEVDMEVAQAAAAILHQRPHRKATMAAWARFKRYRTAVAVAVERLRSVLMVLQLQGAATVARERHQPFPVQA